MKGVRVLQDGGGYMRDADGVVWTTRLPEPGSPRPVRVGRRASSVYALRWKPGRNDVYWPESVSDVIRLASEHAGLVFSYTANWRCTVMSDQRRLTLENRRHVLASGHAWCQFGRENETSPGYFFGFMVHDGAKWIRSPVMQAQLAQGPYQVVVDYDWMPELQEHFGFYA